MKTVYVETSILSYLTARPSRDLLAAAHQQVTRTWWDLHRTRVEVFISPLVTLASSRGDPDAARRRLDAETKPIIRSVCATHGYICPEICTPEDLMGGEDEG